MRPHPLAALALLLLPLATQDPVSGDDVEPEPPRGLRAFELLRLQGVSQLREDILGAWTLRDFIHVERPDDEEKIQAFALFTDGYMAMNVYALDNDDDYGFGDADLLIQSNISRWTIDDEGRLLGVTVMGHGVSEGELERERSGSLREYEAELLDEKTLVLTRPDRSQFVFNRAQSGEFSDELMQRFIDRRAGRGLQFFDDIDDEE